MSGYFVPTLKRIMLLCASICVLIQDAESATRNLSVSLPLGISSSISLHPLEDTSHPETEVLITGYTGWSGIIASMTAQFGLTYPLDLTKHNLLGSIKPHAQLVKTLELARNHDLTLSMRLDSTIHTHTAMRAGFDVLIEAKNVLKKDHFTVTQNIGALFKGQDSLNEYTYDLQLAWKLSDTGTAVFPQLCVTKTGTTINAAVYGRLEVTF